MGRGRKCHYRNCFHSEASNKAQGLKCKFYPLPKDRIQTAQWLLLSGVEHLTPKRVTAYNCFICSCHCPNGKEYGPLQFIEECEFDVAEEAQIMEEVPSTSEEVNVRKRTQTQSGGHTAWKSPSAKNRKVLTPSTKLASEALMLLQNVPEPKQVTYSPKKHLWRLRGHKARATARKALNNMMDATVYATSHEQETNSELCDDLGVAPLLSPSNTSVDLSDENNNVTEEMHSKVETLQLIQEDFNNNCTPDWLLPDDMTHPFDPTASCSKGGVPSPPQSSDAYIEEKSFRSVGIQCERSFISYEKCRHLSEDDFKFYSGVTQKVFELLYDFLGGDNVCDKLKYEYKYSTPKREPFNSELTSKSKLFLTLLRLRRGIVGRDLKVLFNISEYHALKIAYTWIRFMSLQFKKLDQLMFVSAAAQNPLKPKCFEKFPNLRVIIDSTEFKIQRPKHFQQQNNTYSAYKSSNTMKFLVGISCFGGLSFLSEGFEGSISDRKLLVESGLMDYLQPEDAIMADRGFDCEDLCDEKEVNLLIPAFLDKRTHFTARELILNRSIAVSRIHVETFIGLIKQFRLVRYTIPNALLPIASDLVRVCAYLVNFQLPFIKDEDDAEK